MSRADWWIDYPLYPQPVFGGGERKIEIHVNNREDREVERELGYRVVDCNITNKEVIMQGVLKKVRMLPYQRVIDYVTLPLPNVEKPISWCVSLGDRFGGGSLALHIYPTNLMKLRLKELVGEDPIGLVDDGLICRPVFDKGSIAWTNLAPRGAIPSLTNYQGRLVIVFGEPDFNQGSRLPEMAARGIGVAWIQPGFETWIGSTKPSYFVSAQGKCAVVVVQYPFISELSTNPWHQLRLLECCRLAVKPEPMRIPGLR